MGRRRNFSFTVEEKVTGTDSVSFCSSLGLKSSWSHFIFASKLHPACPRINAPRIPIKGVSRFLRFSWLHNSRGSLSTQACTNPKSNTDKQMQNRTSKTSKNNSICVACEPSAERARPVCRGLFQQPTAGKGPTKPLIHCHPRLGAIQLSQRSFFFFFDLQKLHVGVLTRKRSSARRTRLGRDAEAAHLRQDPRLGFRPIDRELRWLRGHRFVFIYFVFFRRRHPGNETDETSVMATVVGTAHYGSALCRPRKPRRG